MEQHLVSDGARDSGIQGRHYRSGYIHGHPYAGTDQAEGREPLHHCRQQLANHAEGQQILCGRRQEALPLARHPHGHAHCEGCSQHRDCADIQSVDPRPDCGDGDEGVGIGLIN